MEARHLNPSNFSDAEIRTLAFAIAPLIKESFVEDVLIEEEAAQHVRYSLRTFKRYVAAGKIRACQIDANGTKRYFKSMLNEDLKKLLKP